MGEKVFKSGYIAIVGAPNVGKLTLLNQLAEAKNFYNGAQAPNDQATELLESLMETATRSSLWIPREYIKRGMSSTAGWWKQRFPR